MRLRRLICFLWILGEEDERWLDVAQHRFLVRRFSTTSGFIAVHVDAWSSLTSQNHLGSPELSGGVRDNFVQVRGFKSRSTKWMVLT
ncbi:unnamed protein product [Brassica oleracea var. botrytis]|uniref:Uncharacterized protein n=1 Tax=Brassica oleracea TaxID=3712 RepID=A0A3P6E4V8_BRAOL|nr:unnamed protein product [Brassica oleracea]